MSIYNNPNTKVGISQTLAILKYMRQGNAITPADARRLFGCDRLGARIADIEKLTGQRPERKLVSVTGRDPQGRPVKKHVMSYWITQDKVWHKK